MELRRAIKKLPSEKNLRVLSSLIISLANKVDSTSEKCINPFTPNTAYAKGSYVTHDNYIYESKLACNDADWVESHWVRLSDTIEELTVNDVKAFLNLTPEQIQTLSSIILDAEVRLDKTWSSSKIYTDIQDALKEAKQYCITELAKKSTGSFKKANDTTEVTDGNYLYLILNPSTSKYDIYALVDSNVELLTSVDVNLDDYYTKTETDNSFLKKTDATSTYATITTVDGKVDKTDIVDNLTSTDTDKPLSANQGKILKDEVDKKGEIDDTQSSTTTVYSSNKVDEITSSIEDISITKELSNLDFNNLIPTEVTKEKTFLRSYSSDMINAPSNEVTHWIVKASRIESEIRQTAMETHSNSVYVRSTVNGTDWMGWQKVCATGVADVPVTNLTWADTTYFDNSFTVGTGCNYQVKNGVCFVNIDMLCNTPMTGGYKIPITLPTPNTDYVHSGISSLPRGTYEHSSITIAVAYGGTHVAVYGGISGDRYLGAFSYPVAES